MPLSAGDKLGRYQILTPYRFGRRGRGVERTLGGFCGGKRLKLANAIVANIRPEVLQTF